MDTMSIPWVGDQYPHFKLYDYLSKAHKDKEDFIGEVHFKKGETIYFAGQSTHCMYEIVNGAVKLGSYSDDGEPVIYDVLFDGDFFGNLKYLNGQFYEFSKAIVNTKVRTYDLSFYKNLIVHDPNVSEWFNYYVIKRWSETELKLLKVNWKTVASKLEFLRKRFDKDLLDANGKRYNLYESLTKKDLGDMTGNTRQTISSALRKM